METRIDITSDPTEDDIKLLESNLEQAIVGCDEPRNHRPFCIFLRDPAGAMLGGLRGGTVWGWLQIKNLWIADELRDKGFGTKLVRTAEEEAIKRDCIGSVVDTFDFQAVEFYEKLGYTQFGVQEDFPRGHKRIYLQKRL